MLCFKPAFMYLTLVINSIENNGRVMVMIQLLM